MTPSSTFALARTYEGLSEHALALKLFDKRRLMQGDSEETYAAHLLAARSARALNMTTAEVVSRFRDAENQALTMAATEGLELRAEATCELAEFFFAVRLYDGAHDAAQDASRIALPVRATLLVDPTVYAWRARLMVAKAAFEARHYYTTFHACEVLLNQADSELDDAARLEVVRLSNYALSKLAL